MKMRVIKLFGIIALTLLALGCSGPMNPLQDAAPEQGLRITVSARVDDARTLNPEQPVFSKYELTLNSPGQVTRNETITSGNTITITDLDVGQWTVSVTGYVDIDVSPDNGSPIQGEFEAAWGEDTVTVTQSGLGSLEIEISADNRNGEDGYFSYSVSYPDDLADLANIVLYERSWGYSYDFDQSVYSDSSSDGTLSGVVALAPGNYLMQITVSGGNVANTAARTEVVHIYSNMETVAGYSFTAADFTRYYTLSGTVSATIDGVAAVGGYVNICADIGCNNEIGWDEFDENNAGWYVNFAATAGQTFYISVDAYDADDNYFTQKNVRSVTLADQITVTGLNLSVSFTSISLSGTITVTMNGETPDEAWLGICRDADYLDWIAETQINGNNWQVKVPNDVVGTTVYFLVYAGASIDGIEYWGEKEVGGRAITAGMGSISLGTVAITSSEGSFTLSGTANITIDGEPMNYGFITAYEDSDYIYDISRGYIYEESGTWTWEMDFPAEYLGQTIYIKVEAYDDWGTRYEAEKDPITLSNLPLPVQNITHNFTKPALEGTVTIKMNGSEIETATVGQELLAYSDLYNQQQGDILYQWYSGSELVGVGFWLYNYTVQASDQGNEITVTVSCSGNSGSVSSRPVTVITAENSVVVQFEGFYEEEIDLYVNGTQISQWDTLIIYVNGGSYSSYQWFVDGQERQDLGSSSNSCYLYGSDFLAGLHSVAVVVTDYNGVPYSKEVTFTVVK